MEDGDVAHMLAGLKAQLALVTVRDAVRAADRTELCRTLWALADRQTCLLHTRGPLDTLVRAARTTRSYKAQQSHITVLFESAVYLRTSTQRVKW